MTVRGVDGAELGTVQDIYRVGETEVFIVERRPVRQRSTCRRSARSSASSRRAAARSWSTPTRSTCGRRASRATDPDRPRAPRRRSRRRAASPADHGEPDVRPAEPAPATASDPAPGDRRRATEPGTGMTLEIDILTLFPAMVEGPLAESIPGRIQEQGLATIRVHDLRDWGLGRHRSVDDAPYGGGAGMILRPEPVAAASTPCAARTRR